MAKFFFGKPIKNETAQEVPFSEPIFHTTGYVAPVPEPSFPETEPIITMPKTVTVIQEKIVTKEVPVEVVVYKDMIVEVPVEKLVYKDKIVEVVKIVENTDKIDILSKELIKVQGYLRDSEKLVGDLIDSNLNHKNAYSKLENKLMKAYFMLGLCALGMVVVLWL